MQLITGFTGNRHSAWFCRMLKLPVAAALTDERPTIVLQHAEDFSDFHREAPFISTSDNSFCRANAILVARKANDFEFVTRLQAMLVEKLFGLAGGGTERFMSS